jgi:hypothetical protein
MAVYIASGRLYPIARTPHPVFFDADQNTLPLSLIVLCKVNPE